jgi:hypothetical protein
MKAGREGQDEVAPLYLNTGLRDRAAADLARKLFAVLDRRLPPRLNELSDRPEGSLANLLKPDEDIIGTIATDNGPLELLVERVNRGALGPVWLFSHKTLDATRRLRRSGSQWSIGFCRRFAKPHIGDSFRVVCDIFLVLHIKK